MHNISIVLLQQYPANRIKNICINYTWSRLTIITIDAVIAATPIRRRRDTRVDGIVIQFLLQCPEITQEDLVLVSCYGARDSLAPIQHDVVYIRVLNLHRNNALIALLVIAEIINSCIVS